MKKSTSFNFVLSSIIFLTFIFTGNAQLQNANWYFGQGAGLNFNDGTQPGTILTDSEMYTDGSSATVSDASGNLLFYTDGLKVWHKNHQVMKDGAGLYGSMNVSQSVVVLQEPDNEIKYHVVTNQGFEEGSHGLSYSYLDMDAEDNFGNIDADQKNVQLLPYSSEKLTAVFNPTNNSYWIISFGPSTDPEHSDTFTVFKLEGSNGITLHNQFTFSFLPEDFDHSGGQMKISPDGTTLAMVHNTIDEQDDRIYEAENIFSFDFNMATGEIHSKKNYTIDNVLYCYGLEFSPNSHDIFVTTTHEITDKAEYNSVYQICYKGVDSEYFPIQFVAASETPIYSLQLGIDNIIHVASYMTGYLYCFTNPDGHSQNTSFQTQFCYLNGRFSAKGLPQNVIRNQTVSKPEVTKVYTVLNNPFNDELRIKYHATGKFKMKMYKMSGKRVKNKLVNIIRIDQVIEIDTRRLNPGVYLLNVKDKDYKDHNETVLKTGGHGDDDDDDDD